MRSDYSDPDDVTDKSSNSNSNNNKMMVKDKSNEMKEMNLTASSSSSQSLPDKGEDMGRIKPVNGNGAGPTEEPKEQMETSTNPKSNTGASSLITASDNPAPTTNNDLVAKACDLDRTEWFPSSPSFDWRLYTPYVIFLNGLDSASIAKDLPELTFGREPSLHTFDPNRFQKYLTRPDHRTKVWSARQRMYAGDYFGAKKAAAADKKYYYDSSQLYLFRTPPEWILCTCPWAKLVAILENPIHRLMRQYAQAKKNGLTLELQVWMKKDLKLLDQSGVFKNEENSWETYLQVAKDAPVGRGLYYLQVKSWLEQIPKAFPDMQNWSDHLLILPNAEMEAVRHFLSLHNRTDVGRKKSTAPLDSDLSPELRQTLEKLYEQFNNKLFKLLGWDAKEIGW